MKIKDFETAIDDFRHVTRYRDNLYRSHGQWYMALCYIKLGNYEEAYSLLKKLINSEYYHLNAQELILRIEKYV